ncbi:MULTISPECIES: hypothetical protein [Pseudomonas]|uniref:hypothetical protein n=1 Tax=Pseudomonas TaxID=286 RepID=UPI0018A399E9|nr:hypothetical protein [Pseudomonas monteilii]BBV97751.1 hypothetical protein STW0522PSE72_31020 [Pseudomonas monteilii]
MSTFLQYGYLGFLGLVVLLSYRIIVNNSGRTFVQSIVFLGFFGLIATVGGGAGYMWASKELEAANAKKSSIALILDQVNLMQAAHKQDMQPLQEALDDATNNWSRSVLNSTRKEYHDEVVAINEIITARNNAFLSQLSTLQALTHDKAQ